MADAASSKHHFGNVFLYIRWIIDASYGDNRDSKQMNLFEALETTDKVGLYQIKTSLWLKCPSKSCNYFFGYFFKNLPRSTDKNFEMARVLS